ncbi:hypothetical protein OFN20_22225, partial [Escherichia coli]|nr:hypothetical protein [Escherichia coli]
MQKSFRFTNSSIKALPANTDTRSTELEVSDTEVIGLKCLSGRTGNDSNLLIVFYVQIMPDDFVMQLHR